MAERVATAESVVINVKDMEREKEFWMGLLGVGVTREFAGFFTWLDPQHEGGISVALQFVPDPTEGRNRLHIDTSVDDLDEARRRIEELGGAHVEDHEIAGFNWVVMADPEGNEFCIVKTP